MRHASKISVQRLLIFSAILLLTVGCHKETLSPTDALLNSLADTVMAGESREVFLATGTGYFFYDDALGEPRRSQFGFSYFDYRCLASWDIVGSDGVKLNQLPDYAIVHPEYIKRCYANGVIETIEAIPGSPLISVTVNLPEREETVVRLWEDNRQFGALISTSNFADSSFHSAPMVAFDTEVTPDDRRSICRQEYSESVRRYEVSSVELYSRAEYPVPKTSQFRFTYAARVLPPPNWKVGKLGAPELYRNDRRAISRQALGVFEFNCQNSDVPRALAWARLSLFGLFSQDEFSASFISGIPDRPFTEGFNTGYSLAGLSLADSSKTAAFRLIDRFLSDQGSKNVQDTTDRLPTAYLPDVADYSNPATTGALTLHISRLLAESDSIPPGFEIKFTQAIDRAVGWELRSQYLVSGLIASRGAFPFIGFPGDYRNGAAFEAQALFAQARNWLRMHQTPKSPPLRTPDLALKGGEPWVMASAAPIAVNEAGDQFPIPISAGAIQKLYKLKSGLFADRLLIPSSNRASNYNTRMKWPPMTDTSQTPAHILALGWLDGGDKRLNARLLYMADSVGLIAPTGFRSLSQTDSRFLGSHAYSYDGTPSSSLYSGDILIWTAGRLADMYALNNEPDKILALFNALTSMMMSEGVIGGLPEATNGIAESEFGNATQNAIYAASLAEYVRIFYDHILGIKSDRPLLPEIHPNIPMEWGEVSFSFICNHTRILITRRVDGVWTAAQSGTEDPVTLAIEIYPEKDKRAMGSITIQPEETTLFQPRELRGGIWVVERIPDHE